MLPSASASRYPRPAQTGARTRARTARPWRRWRRPARVARVQQAVQTRSASSTEEGSSCRAVPTVQTAAALKSGRNRETSIFYRAAAAAAASVRTALRPRPARPRSSEKRPSARYNPARGKPAYFNLKLMRFCCFRSFLLSLLDLLLPPPKNRLMYLVRLGG